MTSTNKPPRSVWCWRINGGPWIATKSSVIADACKIEGLPVQRYVLPPRRKTKRKPAPRRGRKGGAR